MVWVQHPATVGKVFASQKEYDAARYAYDVEATRTKARARYAANRELILAQKKARRDADPTNYRHRAKVRNKRLRQNKPACVQWSEVDAVYKGCPDGMVVDHQIPIIAKRGGVQVACGLHAPWNMQYLDPINNIQKSCDIEHRLCNIQE